MLLKERALQTLAAIQCTDPGAPSPTYLVGASDEIGTHNYNIDRLQGWFKR